MKKFTDEQLFDLQGSSEYADYIMENAKGDAVANGDMLLDLMENGVLFDEFILSVYGVELSSQH